ncbi:MAG TPA: 7TM-DISM domain-containing protein [Thermoanaerobaculia bacterium]|jgi:hypothetical protein|nr:7TM-DISM domain-containing protein [Thermoanaerobaculia bacterium]
MRSCVALLLLLLLAATAAGQERVFSVDAEAVRAGKVIDLPRTWTLRDVPIDPQLWPDRVHPAWTGEGSFALPFEIPSALVGAPLALRINAPGTAVVHLDGQRIAVRGGLTGEWDGDALIPIRFDRAGRHELLVHYANPLTRQLLRAGRPAGFTMVLGRAEAVYRGTIASSRRASFMVWFFTTVFLAFGLLHFCLWLFQRHAIDNLWFSGLCLANASLVFFLFYKDLTTSQRFMLISEPVMNVSGLLFGLFAVRFVYGVFPWRFARPVFLTMTAAAAIVAVWSVIHTWRALPFVFGFMLLSCVEVVRVVVAALWRRRSGARLIGFGVLALGLGFGIALLRNLGWIPAAWTPGGNLIPFASMVVLIGTMSLYLSREFARTDRELRRQLVEVAGSPRRSSSRNAARGKKRPSASCWRLSTAANPRNWKRRGRSRCRCCRARFRCTSGWRSQPGSPRPPRWEATTTTSYRTTACCSSASAMPRAMACALERW